ncbi:MAG TPA: hypothetical protein VFY84_08285, partial [Jiangellales bacterium]|nr:hypothetical protein [Jiangellales bacterium]
EFASAPPLRSEGLLLDFHRSQGARQMETMLFEGAVEHAEVGLLRLYLSSLSVGFVAAELDIPDGPPVDLDTGQGVDEFKAYESRLTAIVGPLVAGWAARASRSVRPEWTQPRPSSALPASSLLWWHRIAVDPPADSEFSAPRLYGVSVAIGDGVNCAVGNGFTNIYGSPGPLVDHVAEGIMVATQEWLIVDEAQRLLSEHLVRLSQTRSGDLVSVDSQYDELLGLTREVTLRKLVLSEEQRYLANTRTKIKDAATESWRLDDQTRELDGRIAALRDLFALHRERITNDRDERRNRLIFVFTAITLIQSVLFWYDFLTEPNIDVAGAPRPAIALVVLGLTGVALVAVLWQQLSPGRRRRHAAIQSTQIDALPKQRKPDPSKASAARESQESPAR